MSGPVIVGIGVDVVDIARFGASLRRTPGLRGRLFTDAEAALPLGSQAARFAAKEALAKALDTDGSMEWTDVRVVSRPSGKPEIEMTGTVLARAEALGVTDVQLSLSHDGGIASAFVIASGEAARGE